MPLEQQEQPAAHRIGERRHVLQQAGHAGPVGDGEGAELIHP
jgi:hypothetical protein